MKCNLEKIYLLNKKGEKRKVSFKKGLTVITGDSKTGKSALIEIVDYCLFASRSSIPKGKVSDFSDLYVAIFKVDQKFLIIGRPSPKSKEWKKAYFNIEFNNNFLENFSINYFLNLELKSIKDDIQIEFEKHLGLSVLNTTEKIDEKNKGKASIRDIVSFIFQHQNLIANKHALFYRFEDSNKKQRCIDLLPVFLGWVDGEYYYFLKELEANNRTLNANIKMKEKLKEKNNDLKIKLVELIDDYYLKIGLQLDRSLSFDEIKRIGLNLPSFNDKAYLAGNIIYEIEKLENDRENLSRELFDIEENLNGLKKIKEGSLDYGSRLKMLENINNFKEEKKVEEMKCPLCSSRVYELEETIQTIRLSRENLIKDLIKTGNYLEDSSKEMSLLRTKRDKQKIKIRKLTAKINQLTEQNQEFKKKRNLRDQIMILKGTIEATINQILEKNVLAEEAIDLEVLKNKIENLKGKIKKYDLKGKIKRSNEFLNARMNIICEKLDFEEELKPSNLNFNLSTFEFFHLKNNEKIFLSEMGSGANWLACHLSLFLALMSLFSKEKGSLIPNILFIDQPSQVYFPKGFLKEKNESINDDENIMQVQNIFNTILEEIEFIKKEYKKTLQVIVLEHADELVLKKGDFNDYVEERWYKNGKKLI